jgi:hypothetical protein
LTMKPHYNLVVFVKLISTQHSKDPALTNVSRSAGEANA